MKDIYHKLTIFAGLDTEIWLGDRFGHFVAKHTGVFEERLKPGRYVVHLGLKGPKYGIRLDRDLLLTESELRENPDMKINDPKASAAMGRILAVILALAAVLGIIASINSAEGQEIAPHAFLPTCADAADSQALVDCIKLRLPERQRHTVETVIAVLGEPGAQGAAVACPEDATTGEPIEEKCTVYPSLVFKIANAVVVAVFGEDQDDYVLVHLSISEVDPNQAPAAPNPF